MPIWQYPFGTERKLARNRRFLLDTFLGGGSMFNLGSESLKKTQTICKNVPPKGSQTRSLTSSGNTSAWREPRPQVFLMDLVHLFQDFQWDSKASGLQSITLQAGSKALGPTARGLMIWITDWSNNSVNTKGQRSPCKSCACCSCSPSCPVGHSCFQAISDFLDFSSLQSTDAISERCEDQIANLKRPNSGDLILLKISSIQNSMSLSHVPHRDVSKHFDNQHKLHLQMSQGTLQQARSFVKVDTS